MLLLLFACVDTSGGKDPQRDSGVDSDPGDSTSPDSPSESSPGSDSAPPPPDSDTPPPETDVVTLSSDDVASDGDCTEVTPVCEAGVCTVDGVFTTVTLSGTVSPGPGWAIRLSHPDVDLSTHNQIDGSGWGLYTAFGSFASWPESSTYEMRAFTGTWDISLEEGSRGATIQTHLPVASGVELTADTTLDLAVDLHEVSLTVTVDGVATTERAVVRLEDAATGAWATATPINGRFTFDVPDGTWTATYTPATSAEVAIGEWSLESIVVAGADVTVEQELAAQTVTGTITVDGSPLEYVGPSTWSVLFFDEAGESWEWNTEGGGDIDVRLPAGTYSTAIETFWALTPSFTVEGDTNADLANDTEITMTGTFTIDGATPDDWWLVLEDPEVGTTYGTGDAAWALDVNPSVYDVYASYSDEDTVVRARVANVALATPDTLDVEVDLARISGTVSWGDSGPEGGFEVHFYDVTGERSMTWREYSSRFTIDLPVGTYDVYVLERREPVGAPALLALDWELTGDVNLDLEIPTWPVSGTFTVDGVADAEGTIYVHSEMIGDTYRSDVDADGTWSDALPAGAYTIMAWSTLTNADGTVSYVPLGACVQVGG